jgi:hypothetical protein
MYQENLATLLKIGLHAQFFFIVTNLFRIICPMIRNRKSDTYGILFDCRRDAPLTEWRELRRYPIHRMQFHQSNFPTLFLCPAVTFRHEI